MSVNKQIPSACKLFSIYAEKPEEFSDNTDVDGYFYLNIFDISQSQHRIVRVSKGSNKKSFALKLFQFCEMKTQQRYIFQTEVNIFKKGLSSLVDNLLKFLKTFDQAKKCLHIRTPKPKIEIGSTKSKGNLFAHYFNAIIEHPNRQFCLSFLYGIIKSWVFSIKGLNCMVISSYLQKLPALTFAKNTISPGTDVTLQPSVK